MLCTPCGRWSGAAGAVTCDDCGSVDKYCPGSDQSSQTDVQSGFYTTGGTEITRTGQAECEAGYYCPGGVKLDCGAVDKFCPGTQQTSPTTAQAGFYTTGGTEATRTGETQCEAGHYCSGGVKVQCPAGTFGNSPGLSTAACDGPCPAGYYCPAGTAGPLDCGDATLCVQHGCAVRGLCVATHCPPTLPPRFCPEGAGVPSDVQEGYYTTPLGVAAANRESEAQCEAGYFCHNGVRSECGEFQWCAAGVSSPTVVKPGEYSTPTSAPATRREAVVQCEAGYYCTEGVRQPCPAGVFTAQTSQTKCSDKCTAGYVALLCRRVVHPAPVVLSSRPNSSRVQLLLYWRRVYWHAERLWRHRSVLPRGLVGSHFRRGWVLHG